MMKVGFLGLEVEVPDDPVGFIKGKVVEILNYLGYEWPVTDESVLDSWGDKWEAIEGRINAYVADLDAGVAHVGRNNEGPAVDAFNAYVSGGESSVDSLRSIADAAPIAAASYRGAATLIRTLRGVVIGKLILDAVSLAAAIISGGASAAASFLIRMGVGAAINVAIDQAMNALLGAE